MINFAFATRGQWPRPIDQAGG